MRRRILLAVEAATLTLPLIAIAAPTATAVDRGKLSPAMAGFVDRGGYGPIKLSVYSTDGVGFGTFHLDVSTG